MMRIGASLVLALLLTTNGCWFGRKKTPAAATPPVPTPLEVPKPKTRPVKPIEPPPDTTTAKPVQSLPDVPEIKAESNPLNTPPPKPPSKSSARRRPKPANVQPPVAAPVTPPPAAVQTSASASTPSPTQPVPQLGVLLTQDQRNKYEAEYSRDMATAMDGLTHVLEYSATPAQRETMTRIRSFMRQAEDAHSHDLATAAQLARRAAVLAQDLAQSQR